MKKSLLILVLTALSACGSTETAPDEFTIIAEEWQGGNINEMIAVWGNPKLLRQSSADGESYLYILISEGLAVFASVDIDSPRTAPALNRVVGY